MRLQVHEAGGVGTWCHPVGGVGGWFVERVCSSGVVRWGEQDAV